MVRQLCLPDLFLSRRLPTWCGMSRRPVSSLLRQFRPLTAGDRVCVAAPSHPGLAALARLLARGAARDADVVAAAGAVEVADACSLSQETHDHDDG